MTTFYPALRVDVEEDLLPLSALLHQRGVVHRIYEDNGRQVLAVQQHAQAEQVKALYQAWRAGKVRIELDRRTPRVTMPGRIEWHSAPVTLVLIALSVLGFGLVYLQAPVQWLAYFTFTPFSLNDGNITFESVRGQYWRLITPAFLHFGWLHIVFNSLWLWELGGRVERVLGHVNMLLLFGVIALVSNTSQFVFGGPGIFGGMSGVVYGLLGFSWVASLIQPGWAIRPSPAVMLFMVGWLVFCIVGLVQVLGFGAIANAAHVGGLVVGALLGVAFGVLSRWSSTGR